MDALIGREVLDELRSNQWIHTAEVHARVHAGIVTLTGTVRSLTESQAAEQAACGVPGVIDVVNQLRVDIPGGTARSDTDVAHAVRQALVRNPFVPDDLISSNVTDGVVRLHGSLDDPVGRDEAERSVCCLAGVRRVHNLIEVRPAEETLRDVSTR